LIESLEPDVSQSFDFGTLRPPSGGNPTREREALTFAARVEPKTSAAFGTLSERTERA
jgi:hypothetical protein